MDDLLRKQRTIIWLSLMDGLRRFVSTMPDAQRAEMQQNIRLLEISFTECTTHAEDPAPLVFDLDQVA